MALLLPLVVVPVVRKSGSTTFFWFAHGSKQQDILDPTYCFGGRFGLDPLNRNGFRCLFVESFVSNGTRWQTQNQRSAFVLSTLYELLWSACFDYPHKPRQNLLQHQLDDDWCHHHHPPPSLPPNNSNNNNTHTNNHGRITKQNGQTKTKTNCNNFPN
jgi:hypothetical protein